MILHALFSFTSTACLSARTLPRSATDSPNCLMSKHLRFGILRTLKKDYMKKNPSVSNMIHAIHYLHERQTDNLKPAILI